jgi:hypothetical protein
MKNRRNVGRILIRKLEGERPPESTGIEGRIRILKLVLKTVLCCEMDSTDSG